MEKPAKRIYHNGNERVWRALFRCMLDPAYRTKLVGFYADEVRKYLTSSAFYLFLNTLKGGQN